MKLLHMLSLGCFFLFSSPSLKALDSANVYVNFGDDGQSPRTECVAGNSNFGTSGFGNVTPDHWYTITTDSYPAVAPLSFQGNMGSAVGGVYVSPTGFTIGEEGNYWVTISAILQNPGENSVFVPVFLVRNETFDPENPEVGCVVTLEPNIILSMTGTGILQNVTPGTRLSLVATNGGYPLPQDVTVAAWSISLFKLP